MPLDKNAKNAFHLAATSNEIEIVQEFLGRNDLIFRDDLLIKKILDLGKRSLHDLMVTLKIDYYQMFELLISKLDEFLIKQTFTVALEATKIEAIKLLLNSGKMVTMTTIYNL